MQFPNQLRCTTPDKRIGVEFDRRKGHYTMAINHIHSQYELYYLFSGRRSYFIKDRSYSVEAGDLIFIRSGEVHKTSDVGIPEHDRILIYYWESFFEQHPPELAELLRSPFMADAPLLRLPLHERLKLEGMLLAVLEEIHAAAPGYELAVQLASTELLLHAARYHQKNKTAPMEHVSPMHEKISEIVQYINANYAEPISLPLLSEKFYVSISHISRKFKEITGFSFTDYLNLKRIKEAQRLLQQSELSITDISEQVGFDNFSHFGKVFKKQTGVSPRTYRSSEKG
ncbi:AraC family transcriptional regulator [Paenibacillus sp. GD4]|jgi:AraC-like DNA-binding protein|uniref:helix-turn-helix domain-containing protein n=1 Tax=Paenibacillus TaxID=44249 RepID=UPI0025434AD4|nr:MULTISPECIES: AraC family transcriptional regulator [Paenibacillus]MDQ1909837.1 AraC family transcriptional regulator [Paenibacillus sp. GD4]